jgi:hypothetical protein
MAFEVSNTVWLYMREATHRMPVVDHLWFHRLRQEPRSVSFSSASLRLHGVGSGFAEGWHVGDLRDSLVVAARRGFRSLRRFSSADRNRARLLVSSKE